MDWCRAIIFLKHASQVSHSALLNSIFSFSVSSVAVDSQ